MGDDMSTRWLRENRMAVLTEQGPRTHQEDTHLLFSRRGLTVIGVFDGHGGGDVSARLPELFRARLDALVDGGLPLTLDEWPRTIDRMFDHVNIDMRSVLSHAQLAQTGSTATLGFVVPHHLDGRRYIFLANAGDSSTCVLSIPLAHAAFQPIDYALRTQDHKPDAEAETFRIERAGGFVSRPRKDKPGVPRANGILATSRSFGDDGVGPGVIIHTPTVTGPWRVPDDAEAQTFIIAMSDGVTDRFSREQQSIALASMCRLNPSLANAAGIAKSLMRACTVKGLIDNTTVVVYEL